jgi:hypothetical protein
MAQKKTFALITLECRVGQAEPFASGSSNLLDLAIEATVSVLCLFKTLGEEYIDIAVSSREAVSSI